METEIETRELDQLHKQLQQRLSTLVEEFRRALKSQEQEGYAELSAQVRDLADEAAADVLMDSRLSVILRDADELRELREALRRIDDGTYGICIDCEEPIPDTRLRARPTASRCLRCQQRFESEHHRNNPREI